MYVIGFAVPKLVNSKVQYENTENAYHTVQ